MSTSGFAATGPSSGEVGARVRRQWGWVLADGILGVIAGIAALVWPGITVLALALLLGISLLVQGVFEVSAAFSAAQGSTGRGWTAFFGIVAIVAGLICILQPGAGLFAIIFGVTLWLLVAGMNELFAAFYMREHRVWNLALGILSIVLGIIMIATPSLALSTAAVLAGVFFLIRGIAEISLALRLRQLPGRA